MSTKLLNLSNSSVLGACQKLQEAVGLPNLAPRYAIDAPADAPDGSSRPTLSLSALLKQYGIRLTANQAYHQMVKLGIDPMFVPLRAPAVEIQETLNAEGRLTLLLGRLATLMGDNSVSQLASRLENRLAVIASQQQQREQLSGAFQTASEEAQSAMDVYKTALDSLAAAQAAYHDCAGKLERAEAKLDGLAPGAPDYVSLKQEIDTLRNELSSLRSNQEKALNAAEVAHNSARQKTEKLDGIASQIQGVFLTGGRVERYQTDNLNSIAHFTMLLSIFIELVGKNNEESLKNDMALFRTLQESRQEEMLKKSEEYQEETRKAEVLNRTMGCVGKVVGALLTVASVVAAAFTGGAALGLAAASLALILTDGIVKAATGTSFIQEALNPVINCCAVGHNFHSVCSYENRA